MTYKDIFKIAESIEKILPEIAKDNNGKDERQKISVTINASRDEIDDINENMYLMNHRDLRGIEYTDEIDINIYDMLFKVVVDYSKNESAS